MNIGLDCQEDITGIYDTYFRFLHFHNLDMNFQ